MLHLSHENASFQMVGPNEFRNAVNCVGEASYMFEIWIDFSTPSLLLSYKPHQRLEVASPFRLVCRRTEPTWAKTEPRCFFGHGKVLETTKFKISSTTRNNEEINEVNRELKLKLANENAAI